MQRRRGIMWYIVAHEVPELALEVDRRAVAFDNKDTELKKNHWSVTVYLPVHRITPSKV